MSSDRDVFTENPTISDVKNAADESSIDKKMFNNDRDKFYGILFLGTVTSISALIGFGTTVAAVRKRDPKYFEQGVIGGKGTADAGVSLAMRALGWGTVYAVTGCGLLFYGIWKWSGATNALQFREKMGSILPRLPKNDPPQSRTEFEGLNDLLSYISEEWGKEKPKDSNSKQ